MYKTGSSQQELLDLLEELSALTGLDRVPKVRQPFHVDAQITPQGTLSWAVDTDPGKFTSAGAEMKKGSGYGSLMEAISGLNHEEPVDERIVVLALAKADGARNYDGSIHTVWYVLDPCTAGMDAPVVKDGNASFSYPVLDLDLTEPEYKSCAVSKVAFYDEFSGTVYPVQECAYQSVSSALSAYSAFKPLCNPLLAAMILAERLSAVDGLRFLYRKRSDLVKPLISLVKRRYEPVSQYEVLKKALYVLQSQAVAKVGNWTVTDEMTKVTFQIPGLNAMWIPEIELRISDISGLAISASASVHMGHGRILVHKNSGGHEACVSRDIESLFGGLLDGIAGFEETWDTISGMDVVFSRDMLEKHIRILGKRRSARLVLPADGVYNAGELVYEVVDATHASLNDRWSDELGMANREFFLDIAGQAVQSAGMAAQAIVPAAV